MSRSEKFDELRRMMESFSTQLGQMTRRMDRLETRSRSSRSYNRTKQAAPLCVAPKGVDKEECTKSIQIDQEAIQELPTVDPRLIPAASSCVTPQQVVSTVQGEEPSLLLISKEEGIDQHPSVDLLIIEQCTHEDDRAIVPRQPTHPVVPKQLRQHLVRREEWPRFFFLKEFPQMGNSKLTIQIGESVRVLHYLNDGTNNFEFLAEIQVLPTLGTNNSSVIVNDTEEMREDPFREGGNDEVIASPIKVTNRPTGIEDHFDPSKSMVFRNLEQKVLIELKIPQSDPSVLLETRSLYINKIDCVKI